MIYFSMDEAPDARALLAAPVGAALFFAGEATDPKNFMTAHAAMGSGLRAAAEVTHALRGSDDAAQTAAAVAPALAAKL